MRETYFNYRQFRWLWLAAGSVSVLSAIYLVYTPQGGHNGGTLLGSVYGVLALVCVAALLWYSKRKREYAGQSGPLRAWLAAHIWIGLGVLIIVPLHSGFQFGWNVHGWAYYLLVGTVLTGVWGTINYGRFSAEGLGREDLSGAGRLIGQNSLFSDEIRRLASGRSREFTNFLTTIEAQSEPAYYASILSRHPKRIPGPAAARLVLDVPLDERGYALQVIDVVNRKRDLCRFVQEAVHRDFWLKIWLYFHVPLACAAAAAILIHLFLVVCYR